MQECKNSLQEDLKAYLDGELPPLHRAAVEKHLASCPACQAELAALRQLATHLTETLPATAPLPDALRARILAALPEPPATPRRLMLPFWRRPGPMATFGGALAMGCAFWLWLKVPQNAEHAPTKAIQVAAVLPESPKESMTFSSQGAEATNRAVKSESASAPAPKAPVLVKPAAPAAAKSAAPLPATIADAKLSKTLSAPARSNTVDKATSRGAQPAASRANSLAWVTGEPPPQEPTKKAEIALDSPTAVAPLAATANVPNPALGAFATKATAERADKKDSDIAGAMVRDAAALPPPAATYTLTIPPGKRTETLEAIRKLAGELAVNLNSEQPELDMRLPADGREALLERLKALGKLAETPVVAAKAKKELAKPDIATRGGFGGGRGGGDARGGGGAFGGGSRAGNLGGSAEFNTNKPPLRLTIILKEAPPEEPQ